MFEPSITSAMHEPSYIFASNTDEHVVFTKEECLEIPYACDILNDEYTDPTVPLHVPFATTSQLTLLRNAIQAKGAGSYSPKNERFAFGETTLPRPPFAGLVWAPPFEEFLRTLSPEEMSQLIRAADAMCMWSLRDNLIRRMFVRILFHGAKLGDFFSSITSRLDEVMRNIYYAELNSVSHSGYYDLLSNSRSE